MFIAIVFLGVFATPQGSDELVYNGDTLSVYLNLLPNEFYKANFDWGEGILNDNVFGNKKPCWITACGNGYQAMWEIIEDQLYLTGIYSCCYSEDSIKADLDLLFKHKSNNGKVKADWVSEKNIHGGKGIIFFYHEIIVFKQEMEFEFLEGKLLNIKTFDNSNSRQSTYSHNFMKLDNFIYTNIDWDNLPKQKEPIIIDVLFSANEDGIIDTVEIEKKSDNDIFNKEAVRVIKLIPDWDVIMFKGQHFRGQSGMRIVFSEENRKRYTKRQ